MAMNVGAGNNLLMERPLEFEAKVQAPTGGLQSISLMAMNILEARDLVTIKYGGGKLVHLFPRIVREF